MKPENFTSHAITRLNERTSLKPMELNAMLCGAYCVNIGSKPGINKTHYLFYSDKDDNFFVAVLDNLDGTIITVWLLDYQESLGWAVTDDQKEEAVRLSRDYAVAESNRQAQPSNYLLTVAYTNNEGRLLNCMVAKVPISEFNASPEWSFKNLTIIKNNLLEKLKAKKDDVSSMHWLSVREGKKGDFTVINLEG